MCFEVYFFHVASGRSYSRRFSYALSVSRYLHMRSARERARLSMDEPPVWLSDDEYWGIDENDFEEDWRTQEIRKLNDLHYILGMILPAQTDWSN